MSEGLSRTPLYGEHVALGAKMVPFAGFEMPVQYKAGIRAEHEAVRERVGLFDVSHMGEFRITGPGALDLIQRIAVNDASKVEVGQAQYSAMCNETGCVIDDLLVYRHPDHWMLVVNASRREQDLAWVRKHADGMDVEVDDQSDEVALIAVQGPRAAELLARLTDSDLDAIGYYRFTTGTVADVPGTISRTGYTGEDGFELYVAADQSVVVWKALMEKGRDLDVEPAGLGSRDSLRLEVGYALYGNDLDEEHTALESGLGWVVKLDKGDFVGRDALVRQKEEGPPRRLVGFRLKGRGFPRPGYPLLADGREIGVVTSGTASPTLGVGLGLGYVRRDFAKSGTEVGVEIRGRALEAAVERPPFYKDGSIRR